MRKSILRSIASFMVAIFGFAFVACDGNSNANVGNFAEFKMRGQSEIVLTEGYEHTQTNSFKFDGVGSYDYVSVEVENDFDEKLSWNDDDHTLEIEEGLIKGEYSTILTATLNTSSGEKEVEFPFMIKVLLPEIPSGSPKIAGEGFRKVYADYATFSTPRFSLYGTGVSVFVLDVKKDGERFETNAFVWDATERKLNVSAGLGVGVYTVALTASSTDTQYEEYEFIYSFVVQETVAPVINGPTELTIGEGYLGGTLSGFMTIGTDCIPTVRITNESNTEKYGMVSFDKVNDSLEFFAGLSKGVYTITIKLSNGNVSQDVTHDLTLTVEQGETVTGSFAYTSKGFDSDEVVGVAKDANKNFYYPLEIIGNTFSTSLIAGEYDLTLESKYFCETTKNVVVENASVNVEKMLFSVPSLNGNATYDSEGFTLERDNKVIYSLKGATASEGFVVRYTMSVAKRSSDPWVSGGFCFNIDGTWYSILVYPNTRSSSETSVRVMFTQGPSGQWINGGYATMSKKVSSGTATIDVEIAFYNGAFYVCVGEKGVDDELCAVKIGAEFLEEYTCNSTCDSLWFPNKTNFDYSHDGLDGRAKIDVEKFFGSYERVLGFRTVDNGLTFTNVVYELGNVVAKNAIASMQAYAKTCTHSGAWGA